MCYRFDVQGLIFNDLDVRKELVESFARLNAWIFDELAYYQEDLNLIKKIVRIRRKLPINL